MTHSETSRLPLVALCAALPLVGWAFFPTLEFLADKWWNDPQYSHGFLVPFVSLYLLRREFFRRGERGESATSAARPAAAMMILVVCLALRILGGGLLFHQFDALALLGTLAALTLATVGWYGLRTALPAIAFLIFTIPLPYEIERNVGGPLKMVATWASTYALQTLGYPAVAEGNVILIDEVRLGVVDACSGLKMLMTFSAFAFGAVLLAERSKFEKGLILLGIVPIAIFSNVARIVATGVTYYVVNLDEAHKRQIHDLYGFVMMPLGLALLGAQLAILSRLVVKPSELARGVGDVFAPNRPLAYA